MRHPSKIAILPAVGLCLCLAQAAQTQDKETPKDVKAITDRDFVFKASEGGLAEVNLGMLATKQATKPEVKKFAQQMIEDHTKANKELLALADKKRLAPAPRMDARHQQMADKLARLTGAEFDKMYMEGQVKDHEEAVALFEAQAKNGQDAELKAFAEKSLPTLREHLKMARDMAGGGHGGKDR